MLTMLSIEFWWLGFFTYLPFHLLHIVIWRAFPTHRDVIDLFAFLIVLPATLCLLWIGFGGHWSWSAVLLHGLITANYIAIYPALQASSPTVHILCLLLEKSEGMDRAQVERSASATSPLDHRVMDLRKSGMVVPTAVSWVLSGRGKLLAFFFINYRRILGLQQGGG